MRNPSVPITKGTGCNKIVIQNPQDYAVEPEVHFRNKNNKSQPTFIKGGTQKLRPEEQQTYSRIHDKLDENAIEKSHGIRAPLHIANFPFQALKKVDRILYDLLHGFLHGGHDLWNLAMLTAARCTDTLTAMARLVPGFAESTDLVAFFGKLASKVCGLSYLAGPLCLHGRDSLNIADGSTTVEVKQLTDDTHARKMISRDLRRLKHLAVCLTKTRDEHIHLLRASEPARLPAFSAHGSERRKLKPPRRRERPRNEPI
eukprot:tig00001220_g7622.t1